MFAIVLLGLLASANAAPYCHHRHHGHSPDFHHDDFAIGDQYFRDNVFDTSSFWAGLSREMAAFDKILTDFSKHFPSSVSSEGIDKETNEYKITIPLAGYEEKDVIVKAREGVLMVQAVKKPMDGIERNYLDMRTLPNFVNVNGSWTFKDGVLKIVFPLQSIPATEETTTEIVTESPELNREEIDSDDNGTGDADVGVNRGDTAKEADDMINVAIKQEPVEATTYSVDLKDEVEFVPMRY